MKATKKVFREQGRIHGYSSRVRGSDREGHWGILEGAVSSTHKRFRQSDGGLTIKGAETAALVNRRGCGGRGSTAQHVSAHPCQHATLNCPLYTDQSVFERQER